MHALFDHHIHAGEDGSLDLAALPTHGGVYLVTDGGDRSVLLASGENLRRVVAGRLSSPPSARKSRRTDLSQVARRVYWRETFSRFETTLVHWRVARKLDAGGYRKAVSFGPVWFLRLDLEERTPRFVAVREFPDAAAFCHGPFATRRDVDAWICMLEDLFDLCRHHHILEQAPRGQACAYREMGKCPAPCDGSIPLREYRRMITAAGAFTAGDREPRISTLGEAMRAAAGARAFERAAAIRRTLDYVSAMIKKAEYRHMADISDCCWLIVQRGGPRHRSAAGTMVKPFYVRRGLVEVGAPEPMAELESAAPRWLARCKASSPPPPRTLDEQTARCEALWLVGKFLFQGERAPGLFLRFDRLPAAADLIASIRARFSPPAEAPTRSKSRDAD